MRVPLARIVAVVLGGLAVTGAVAGLLVAANAGVGLYRCDVTSAFGWTLPLIAGVTIGVLAWMLHHGGRASAQSEPQHATARCDSCGSALMESWRLCPYCGELIENLPTAGECATRTA